jgi:hypothetical protein
VLHWSRLHRAALSSRIDHAFGALVMNKVNANAFAISCKYPGRFAVHRLVADLRAAHCSGIVSFRLNHHWN